MPSQYAYYSSNLSEFCQADPKTILGELAQQATREGFVVEQNQLGAWHTQITILQPLLENQSGKIYLEYSIPRLGKRIDVVLTLGPSVFVLEFKVGAKHYASNAIDQVMDYALDLKNFHEASHDRLVVPILVATEAPSNMALNSWGAFGDDLFGPILTNRHELGAVLTRTASIADDSALIAEQWERGGYHPTPTIVEAAMALYRGHAVAEISRSDAGAKNLTLTCDSVSKIIQDCKTNRKKVICFVTGVPGAGKTLVGLNIATQHIDADSDMYSIFLSGNGPLVAVLREALARDKVQREKARGHRLKKGRAKSEVQMFIQNVHHFRDDCLKNMDKAPIDHVALFDEAQRAWDQEKTSDFMMRRRGLQSFGQSEPDFLISCMDRHPDWAVVVCLVGGGQEIHTGEAGIRGWLEAIRDRYPHWQVYISPQLKDEEYASGHALDLLHDGAQVQYDQNLHLAVSMRSYRAERISELVKSILDFDRVHAQKLFEEVVPQYPIVLTRSLPKAKTWLKTKARGSERYGIVVSSQAERLKPYAIDVRSPVDPIHWFLDGKDDVRSSYYLEDVATEFHVQGLELDWACVAWDADFRYGPAGWRQYSFRGNKWQHVRKTERQQYQKNAYRVLLTRARQGMVIYVPEGDKEDSTRLPEFYDPIYEYLHSLAIPIMA